MRTLTGHLFLVQIDYRTYIASFSRVAELDFDSRHYTDVSMQRLNALEKRLIELGYVYSDSTAYSLTTLVKYPDFDVHKNKGA